MSSLALSPLHLITVVKGLKFCHGSYILVLVALINKKNEDTIIHAIFTNWIVYFGVLVSFLMYNGDEFNNKMSE